MAQPNPTKDLHRQQRRTLGSIRKSYSAPWQATTRPEWSAFVRRVQSERRRVPTREGTPTWVRQIPCLPRTAQACAALAQRTCTRVSRHQPLQRRSRRPSGGTELLSPRFQRRTYSYRTRSGVQSYRSGGRDCPRGPTQFPYRSRLRLSRVARALRCKRYAEAVPLRALPC